MIFDPITINGTVVRTRFCVPPMDTYRAVDGWVSKFHEVHYGTLVNYGAGMIIVEATAVDSDGRISMECLGLWDDKFIDGHSRIVDYAKENDVFIALQLGHAGRKACNDLRKIAPSAIAFNEDYDVPNEATKDEITHVVSQFKAAAKRALQAGYDAIELHAAHGYLMCEFLSPHTNKRTDEYGGTPENRKRLLFEVLEAVQSEFPKTIIVRISAEEYVEDGNHIDFYVELAKELEEKGVHMIDVSSGGVAPVEMDVYPGYQVQFSEAIKKVVSIPVSAVGLITNYEQAEEILQKGQADIIQVGREMLRKPSTPRDWAVPLNAQIGLKSPFSNYRLK